MTRRVSVLDGFKDFRWFALRLEQRALSLGEFHRSRAFCVIIRHVIDPRAHRITPSSAEIVGPQEFGCRSRIPHPRIEPQVVGVWIKDDWHSVVDFRGNSVWSRGQNGADLQRSLVHITAPASDWSRSRDCSE